MGNNISTNLEDVKLNSNEDTREIEESIKKIKTMVWILLKILMYLKMIEYSC
jgi:hypothetical protein